MINEALVRKIENDKSLYYYIFDDSDSLGDNKILDSVNYLKNIKNKVRDSRNESVAGYKVYIIKPDKISEIKHYSYEFGDENRRYHEQHNRRGSVVIETDNHIIDNHYDYYSTYKYTYSCGKDGKYTCYGCDIITTDKIQKTEDYYTKTFLHYESLLKKEIIFSLEKFYGFKPHELDKDNNPSNLKGRSIISYVEEKNKFNFNIKRHYSNHPTNDKILFVKAGSGLGFENVSGSVRAMVLQHLNEVNTLSGSNTKPLLKRYGRESEFKWFKVFTNKLTKIDDENYNLISSSIVFLPESNYTRDNIYLETIDNIFTGEKVVLMPKNKRSILGSRLHFIPYWYPNDYEYKAYAKFNVNTPFGELSEIIPVGYNKANPKDPHYAVVKENILNNYYIRR